MAEPHTFLFSAASPQQLVLLDGTDFRQKVLRGIVEQAAHQCLAARLCAPRAGTTTSTPSMCASCWPSRRMGTSASLPPGWAWGSHMRPTLGHHGVALFPAALRRYLT